MALVFGVRLGNAVAALMLTACVDIAAAQGPGFPSKTVRIVAPVPAGSTLDMISRTFAQRLTPVWGQPVVVENRPGANFIIGTENVARAAADGHTLLVAPDAAITVNQHLYP